jgi:predicted ATPase
VALVSVKLEDFTAFKHLRVDLGPGINVFIGSNGTGKTHLMKVAYAACAITAGGAPFTEKLERVFLPYERRVGRLVRRQKGSATASATVARADAKISTTFSNHAKTPRDAAETGHPRWVENRIQAAYIPVKEMLANAPGFRSLYALREVHFEEVYADILDRAYLDIPRGPMEPRRRKLLTILQREMDGKIVRDEETFFLRNAQGKLEFTLLAEGFRKLGLLWLLIQNGILFQGSVLFWDEPETNMNPIAIGTLMEVLVELGRLDVQVILATHDYTVLKEIELRATDADEVRFHALYRDAETGDIRSETRRRPFEIEHSAISNAMSSLYDRELQKALQRNGSRK